MILALCGAVAIGLSLGLLGSGGSILTVPVLVYLVGEPEKVAIAGSLAIAGATLARPLSGVVRLSIFGVVMLVAAVMTFRQRAGATEVRHPGRIDRMAARGFAIGVLTGVVGVGGSLAGQRIASRIPQERLRRLFGLFLVVMSLFILGHNARRLLGAATH